MSFMHPRFDLRLLAVAKRLCPMIHDAFECVKEEITQMAIKQVRCSWCYYVVMVQLL